MARMAALALLPLALAACGGETQQSSTNQTSIRVRSPEQDRLHTLDALNLAIALKRAIYAAGYRCQRVTDAGLIGTYKNLDMWMAQCSDERAWAIFAGPDGSAQVRDCKDLPGTGVPECNITRRPKGSFDGPQGAEG